MTITDTPNTEKQEHSNRNEPQSNNNWNIIYPSYAERKLIQEEMNIENLKRIMSEKILNYHR